MTLGAYPLGTQAIGTLDPADAVTVNPNLLRLGTRDFVSRIDDAEPNVWYRGRLLQPLDLGRSVVAAESPVGRLGLGTAEIEIANGDGALNSIFNDAALEGRAVVAKLVPKGQGLDAAKVLFRGVVESVERRDARVRLRALSRDRDLAQPFANGTFGGAGGADGGEDLSGKNIPAAFGHVFGVPAVYLGTIGGRHSYMVSGGRALPIAGIDAVYDRGELIPQFPFPPASGQCSIDLAAGIVTLGGSAAERLTCDVRGYAPAGALKQSIAEIVEAIFIDIQQLPNTRLDFAALAALQIALPAPVGIWTGTGPATALAIFQEMRQSAMLWGGTNRAEQFSIGQLTKPGGVIRAVFNRTNARIRRLSAPSSMRPPAWKRQVGYQRNYTVETDPKAAASDARRAFMAERWRIGEAEDPAILARYPTSKPAFTPGLFRDKADADGEAARELALLRGAGLYEVFSGNVAPELDIGQTVEVTEPDFNLDKAPATILGGKADYGAGVSRLEVFA